MTNLVSNLKKELWENRTLGEWLFLLFGIVLQVITYVITKDSFLSFISGVFGVLSVVYCSQRKVSFYFFGFVQLFTYVVLCLKQNLYGEIGENVFYLVTMVIGIFLWLKHYDKEEKQVITEPMSKKSWVNALLVCLLGSLLLGLILQVYTNDTQPYLDAFSTVPAFIAQILMITRRKEQWIFWLIVDISTGILWVRAGDFCMVAQYIFWIVNCVYGYRNWSRK